VSVKDRITLAPMASLELCTDRMSGFMGPNKPSSFCNYYVEPHIPASCGASGSQAYGVFVRFFPCRVYIDSNRCDTLGYEWQLVIDVIS
jgi:hypothetical protein